MTITQDKLITRVGDLQVLPTVARKAIDVLNNANCAIDDLSDIIEKDQTIAARILKISNSALYGLRQEVTSLQHAMMVLGFKTIRSLVLTATTRSLYKKFGITEKMMWDHSVAVAIAAKLISRDLGSDVEEVAFVGGLMHDLGKVILNNETPDEFAQVMMNIYNDNSDSITAEKEVYGFDHTEIGAGVVQKWKFAPILIEVIGKHHLHTCSLDEIDDSFQAKTIACVNLADSICRFLGLGFRTPDESVALNDLLSTQYLGISSDKIETLLVEVKETFMSEKSAFE